jgi:lipopolysaccharide transport system permease protein
MSMNLTIKKELFFLLLYQEITSKYRNNYLGISWIVITPLFMLSIYTFVFGYVFAIKWPGFVGSNLFEFSLILYSGLVFYNTFSEAVSRSPTIIIENSNYVNKVVFPLEILTVITTISSLVTLTINLFLILLFKAVLFSEIQIESLYIVLIVLFFIIMILGITWIFAAIGVFIRDINHLISNGVQGLLFLSPIFYPISSLPEWLQSLILFNPISIPVEQARKVIIFDDQPDLQILLIYGAASFLIAIIGYYCFYKSRKGFADVI